MAGGLAFFLRKRSNSLGSEWQEDVWACARAVSPAPARPTLAQDAARPHTPHGPGLPAIRVRDAAPWPNASNSICGETRPSASQLQPPRAQQNLPPAARPPCAYAPTKHMPEDSPTVPLRRWSTPHGAGSWSPFNVRALHRNRGRPTSASPSASAGKTCTPSPSFLGVVTYPTRTLL